ncbi:MAG: hypothetical protein ACI4UF_06160, partial [Thermoguttaceae bacterium]
MNKKSYLAAAFFGVFVSCFAMTASAQYNGAPMTPSATPSNLPMSSGAGSAGVMQSTTPNTVNTQFPQGAPVVPGANGQPMPLLNPYQQNQNQTRTFNGPVQYGQYTPSGQVTKPFANVQEKPYISPYMNFYRRDRVPGIDNYNMYVKPALDAEKERQQTQQQIQTLQENQNQTRIQQEAQFNANVGAQTVGASYGQMNTGMNANRPGASYGFSGRGPTVHVDPNAAEKTDKEKKDEKAEEEEQAGSYFNPYAPNGKGVLRPHYEPAERK